MTSTAPSADLEAVVIPRSADLGDGFVVQRVLPSATRRLVGPFVFFDAMGPALLQPGHALDVRPHPHIGLATVTYLFDGEILHRDSLGSVQPIQPHALNWMTAGRGIVHSERTPAALRAQTHRLFGLQAWVALPQAHEETAPAFAHYGADALPQWQDDGAAVRLVAGAVAGVASPVPLLHPTLYLELNLAAGARFQVPADVEERAAWVVGGQVRVNTDPSVHGPNQLLVFRPGAEVVLHADGGPAHLMLLGGAPMDGPRFVWWNFVSSRKDRIAQAQDDWQQQRFPSVPGESEFIPLPTRRD